MKTLLVSTLALLCTAPLSAHAQDGGANFSGTLQAQWDQRRSTDLGPLAQANALQSGIAPVQPDGATLQAELRASAAHWSFIGTAQQQALAGQASGLDGNGQSWLNEAEVHHDFGAWQWSAGKKIVGWDVGYAFRPNDVVQQEVRRTLVATTAEGRPLVMAEHLGADDAWTWVAVNPTADRASPGGREPALAVRYYLRHGAVDWHSFARVADRTGSSVGAAVAWVATDALELHASAREMERADAVAMVPLASTLTPSDPWQPVTQGATTQALVGATWTSESQVSVLVEVWWDGTALSGQQWSDWRRRNQALQSLVALGAPASAVAGNLAWQADAYGASNSLQQQNWYTRISWDHENWHPSLDLLYHPQDGGSMVTAALLWTGDRVKVQVGARANGGPSDAVLAQLPVQRQSYLLFSWSF